MKECLHVDVPKLPELSINKIWPLAIQIPNFLKYLPLDWKPANHKVERDYFWDIMHALAPEFVDALIADSRKQRNENKRKKKVAANTITFSYEIAAQLLAHDFISSRKYHLFKLSIPFRIQAWRSIDIRQDTQENHRSRASAKDCYRACC